MKENELIEKWEQSGFLDTVSKQMKLLYSKNLEKACRFLEIRDGNDQIETMIFPIIFRITKLSESFDIIKIIEDFIEFYENSKFDIYKDYIDDYKNDKDDDKLKIVEKFMINYTNNKMRQHEIRSLYCI